MADLNNLDWQSEPSEIWMFGYVIYGLNWIPAFITDD